MCFSMLLGLSNNDKSSKIYNWAEWSKNGIGCTMVRDEFIWQKLIPSWKVSTRNRVFCHMMYPLYSLLLALWQLSLGREKQNMHVRQVNCSLVRKHLIGGLLINLFHLKVNYFWSVLIFLSFLNLVFNQSMIFTISFDFGFLIIVQILTKRLWKKPRTGKDFH